MGSGGKALSVMATRVGVLEVATGVEVVSGAPAGLGGSLVIVLVESLVRSRGYAKSMALLSDGGPYELRLAKPRCSEGCSTWYSSACWFVFEQLGTLKNVRFMICKVNGDKVLTPEHPGLLHILMRLWKVICLVC